MCVNMILFDALKVFTCNQYVHYFTGLMLMDPVDGLEEPENKGVIRKGVGRKKRGGMVSEREKILSIFKLLI